MQQDMNSQGRRSLFSSEGRGVGGGGGLENERCQCKFVEGSRGILGNGIFDILHGVVLKKINLVGEL